MKNCFTTCFLLLLLLSGTISFGQKKNSVKVYRQGFEFMDANVSRPSINKNGFEDFNLNAILGLSYEREIRNNFGLGAQYTFWWGSSLFYKEAGTPRLGFLTNIWVRPENIGERTAAYNQNVFDVYALYHINLKEQVRFSLKAGPSATSGENEYLTRVWGYYPGAECIRFETEFRKETYYGSLAGISFDYLLWEKRIPVGLDLNARYYHNFPFQLNYGLHAGFNF